MEIPTPKPAVYQATLIHDLDSVIESYKNIDLKHPRGKAAQQFFCQDVDFMCAYDNDYLVKGQGHAGTILIGQWKYHPEHNLFVRINPQHGAISLAKNHLFGRELSWNYEWRGDCKENGFLRVNDSLPLEEIPKVYDLCNKFTKSLEGYHAVVLARENEKIPSMQTQLIGNMLDKR